MTEEQKKTELPKNLSPRTFLESLNRKTNLYWPLKEINAYGIQFNDLLARQVCGAEGRVPGIAKESPIELREDEKNSRDQLVIEELFLKNGVNGLNLAFAAILYPENLKFARFNFGGWSETNQWYALWLAGWNNEKFVELSLIKGDYNGEGGEKEYTNERELIDLIKQEAKKHFEGRKLKTFTPS